MKREMVQILACPVCKGSLELTVTEEDLLADYQDLDCI